MRGRVGLLFVLVALATLAVLPARADEKEHLPFFRAHRDWVLRALEELQPKVAPPGSAARAWHFDPYADESAHASLRAVQASLDSASSLADIGVFRMALDSLLAEAVAAGARLDSLDRCFVAHLRTSLAVTVAAPEAIDLERVEAFLEGRPLVDHPVSPAERAALAAGGVLQIVHRVVEPRAQELVVHAWTRGGKTPSRTALVVAPEPDRLSVFHLDVVDSSSPARWVRSTLGSTN